MRSVYNTGIDWFTATTTLDRVGLNWLEAYQRYCFRKDEQTGSNQVMERKVHRNRWYEFQTAYGLSWGVSSKLGYIVIAKGSSAHEVWQTFLPTARKVSRLDLQVTVKLEQAVEDLGERMYIDATAHSRKLKCTHLVNSQGGSTLYVGSRNSDQFGRLYDKGAQQGGPPGFTWRYEVELKNAYSTAATQYLVNNMGKPTEDQQRDLSAFVYSWWRDRGVKPLFSPVTGDMIVAVSKQQTTLDRKLTWLRGQVRPTIQQLIAAGLGKDALEALGLPDYTQGEF